MVAICAGAGPADDVTVVVDAVVVGVVDVAVVVAVVVSHIQWLLMMLCATDLQVDSVGSAEPSVQNWLPVVTALSTALPTFEPIPYAHIVVAAD